MSFMFQFAAKSSDEDTTPPVTKRAKKPEQIGVETVASTDPGTTQNPQATSVALGVVDNPASIVVPTVGMIERVCLASQFIEPIFGHKGSTIRGLNEAKVEIDAQELGTEQLQSALAASTDVVAGVYEGGLRVWECTVDLLNYFTSISFPWADKTVLELGCGAGYAGIYALMQGASVDFQDYNEEAIQLWTIPNVFANKCMSGEEVTDTAIRQQLGLDNVTPTMSVPPAQAAASKALGPGDVEAESAVAEPAVEHASKDHGGQGDELVRSKPSVSEFLEIPQARFIKGDWASWAKSGVNGMDEQTYDVVLMAETVYNPASLESLAALLDRCLTPHGVVILAAKTYYFGVGGSTKAFSAVMASHSFDHEVNWRSSSGVQREIISYTRRQPAP
eukprot:m.163221 g.163221  ORF g.163221 m.163221 type:complete len:391 (-) comp14380_c0_seq3:115-1287(-)